MGSGLCGMGEKGATPPPSNEGIIQYLDGQSAQAHEIRSVDNQSSFRTQPEISLIAEQTNVSMNKVEQQCAGNMCSSSSSGPNVAARQQQILLHTAGQQKADQYSSKNARRISIRDSAHPQSASEPLPKERLSFSDDTEFTRMRGIGSEVDTHVSLSKRASNIIRHVDEVIRKCRGETEEKPNENELAMFEVFTSLQSSPIGPLFVNHPEVSLSNRSCVITTPDFQQSESIDGYLLRGAYNPGTIGRSYLATQDRDHIAEGVRGNRSLRSRSSIDLFEQTGNSPMCVLKAVSFVLRKDVLDSVIADQRALVNLNQENILKVWDVLNDEYKENMIVVTQYHPKGNISAYSGKLDHDGDKLCHIINEVGTGLRVLHSHKIYHHNIKLDNVLETTDGHYCIADSGFARLFATQCPEALVFNGELACLPPEVFDEDGPYADDHALAALLAGASRRTSDGARAVAAQGSHTNIAENTNASASANGSVSSVPSYKAECKVDIWGFGVFMYRLAFGRDPFEIAECSFEEVRERVLSGTLVFPRRQWVFSRPLEDVIAACLEKNPSNRPTILRLLRFPFFKDMMAQSFSIGRNVSFVSYYNCMGHLGGAAPKTSNNGRLNESVSSPLAATVYPLRTAPHFQDRNGYVVAKILGRGTCSETLLVHLRRDAKHHFVLKLFQKSVLQRMKEPVQHTWRPKPSEEEIRRQLVICRKVNHPNIASLKEIVDGKGSECFALQEYIEGGATRAIPPLAKGTEAVKGGNTLQQMLHDVLLGLIHLHDNDMSHLRLSPSNVFYSETSKCYKIVDFGPMFLTVDELMDAQEEGKPLYSLPLRITADSSYKGRRIDTFFVGLLAASVVPELFNSVWSQFFCVPGHGRLSVDDVLVALRTSPSKVPPQLVSFVKEALTTNATARSLLRHSLLANAEGEIAPAVVLLKVSPKDLAQVVQPRPETRDENRLRDVLGSDPLQGSQAFFSVDFAPDAAPSDSCAGERSIAVTFTGANMRCGQCSASVPVALYKCPECPDLVRCGKCAIGDTHHTGHALVPYVIHTVEINKAGASRAILAPPSSIHDVHALETLEMSANFPVGSLSAHLANQRAMERSMGRSVVGATVSKLLMSANSSADSEGMESMYSVVMDPATQVHDVPTTPTIQPPVVRRATTKNGLLLKSNPFMKQSAKRLALPKEEEVMEDITWQQELEKCHENASTELLLYNYGLTEVPPEIFNPPPLNVVTLDLSQNNLTELPHEVSFLVHLRKLVVSYNKLTDLPDSMGNLKELEIFDASHNMLTDLPQTFIYLTNLESVAMDYNNCSHVPKCLLDILPGPIVAMDAPALMSSGMLSILTSSGSVTTSREGAVIHNNPIDATSPRLSIIYIAANDNLATFPDVTALHRFRSLKLACDNEPALYKYYMENHLDLTLPNVKLTWNKIYPDEIIPYLYCGSLRSAQSQIVYEKLNISYVLTMGRGLLPVPPKDGKHKVIVVDDIPGADILISIQEAVDFIEESQREKAGCLVHCFAGLSRSATTVIAYLMIKKNMRLDEAYLVTKKGRPAILPNNGFFEQLTQLDGKLFPGTVRPLDIASLERSPD